MMNVFSHFGLEFNGKGHDTGSTYVRSRFQGRDCRLPPLRGLVKARDYRGKPLRTGSAKKLRRDILQIQQLGGINIDVAHCQLIDDKFVDFNTAITMPQFISHPELNPLLTSEWNAAMELEAFQFGIDHHWNFDNMLEDWNPKQEACKDRVSIVAFPSDLGGRLNSMIGMAEGVKICAI
jgi:hypothetical protein